MVFSESVGDGTRFSRGQLFDLWASKRKKARSTVELIGHSQAYVEPLH